MSESGTVRAAVYCRLSYAPDGSLEKVERQEADCRSLADRLGWTVGRVYPDNNKSAWRRNVERPEWEQLLRDIDADRWDAVISYHGDRLMRQPFDLERLLTLAEQRHLRLASVSGLRDLTSPEDQYILRLEVARACMESHTISRRVQRGHLAAAEAGKPKVGRWRAWGYERDGVTIRQDEAELINEIADRLLAGDSASAVVRDLTERGVPTVAGGAWSPGNLRSIVTRPRLAGLRTYRGEVVADGQWEPILDRETWHALTLLLKGRAQSRGIELGARARKYLLAGILLCGSCGGRVYVHVGSAPKRKIYFCRQPGCPYRVSAWIEPCDDHVISYVLGWLSDPAVVSRSAPSVDPALSQTIETLQQRRTATVAAFEDPDAEAPADLVRALQRIDNRIAGLRNTLAEQLHGYTLAASAGMTRAQWDELALSRRRAILRDLPFNITLNRTTQRGARWDPERVTFPPKSA